MVASSDPRFGPTEPGASASQTAGAHDAARAAAAGSTGAAEASTASAAGAPSDGGVRATGGKAGTAVAGAAAGTMAGLQAGALAGAVTLGVGAVAGAALGAAAGAALGEDAQRGRFTTEVDEHYRALYEAAPTSGRSYAEVRAAYVFGHVAASEPGLAGQSFAEAEPALREGWRDVDSGMGSWDQVRQYVHDAYGHARAEGAGERRDYSVVGSGGSAVDPVELDRARHGLASVPDDAPSADGPSAGASGADAAHAGVRTAVADRVERA